VEIVVSDHVAGAASARGVTVVIDVFRASSLQCYAFSRGAERIFPIAEVEQARQLKADHPDWLLFGERFAKKLPGFDVGNSPSETAAMDLVGRTIIQTTHAGTQGLTGARGADVVLSAALVNAPATARHIRQLDPEVVTLVRMGSEARMRTEEDDVCAEWLAALLSGAPYDTAGIEPRLRAAPSAQKFFDPEANWAPEADFAHCLALGRFDFVLELAGRDSALPWLSKRTVA
jgi:2-phosphosulfolactate phosphatase